MKTLLPNPTQTAVECSNQLREQIFSAIEKNGGSISFAQYMNLALYEPLLGYYRNASLKFGAQGDFITAPEISSLFSQCLAKQCQQVLNALPVSSQILEIGAGSGQMAADVLLALENENALPYRYLILELSADLQSRQHQKILSLCPHLLSRVQWLNALPEKFVGVILANEVVDAMPTHRFTVQGSTLLECRVVVQDKKLAFQNQVTDEPEILQLFHSQNWSEGYTSEINLNLKPWITSLSQALQQGLILLIDYGFPRHEYYHPDRSMGTLMCHYQHYAHHDPFFCPGLQDITAHVDFTAIAEASVAQELDILGYTNQASFLLSCGLPELLANQASLDQPLRILQNRAIETLTSPAEMGELFKVITLGRQLDIILIGSQFYDRRHSL